MSTVKLNSGMPCVVLIVPRLLSSRRFWWRDARVSEITSVPPSRRRRKPNGPLLFEYPTLFVPVPHCSSPIPLATYLLNVIPQARTVREINVPVFVDESIPTTTSMEVDADQQDVFGNKILQIEEGMAVDTSIPGTPRMTTLSARVETDGLLLYVSEASYQPVSFSSQPFCYVICLEAAHVRQLGRNSAVVLGACCSFGSSRCSIDVRSIRAVQYIPSDESGPQSADRFVMLRCTLYVVG